MPLVTAPHPLAFLNLPPSASHIRGPAYPIPGHRYTLIHYSWVLLFLYVCCLCFFSVLLVDISVLGGVLVGQVGARWLKEGVGDCS